MFHLYVPHTSRPPTQESWPTEGLVNPPDVSLAFHPSPSSTSVYFGFAGLSRLTPGPAQARTSNCLCMKSSHLFYIFSHLYSFCTFPKEDTCAVPALTLNSFAPPTMSPSTPALISTHAGQNISWGVHGTCINSPPATNASHHSTGYPCPSVLSCSHIHSLLVSIQILPDYPTLSLPSAGQPTLSPP
jgi:hypothetical protein